MWTLTTISLSDRLQSPGRLLAALALLLCMALPAAAQWPVALTTRWQDSFREWVFYAEGDEEIGYLRLRWDMYDDWGEWEYRIDEVSGMIRTKWKDDWSVWELTGGNELYTARTMWSGDPLTWQVSGEGLRVTLGSRYTNQLEEWRLTDSNSGEFAMYTYQQRDLRDWLAPDELGEEVSIHAKIFLMFLVVVNSVPRQ